MELTPRSAGNHHTSTIGDWEQVRSDRARDLHDARCQFHHAAQFATAAGISYLAPQADDSHTNLGWHSEFRGLFSREILAPIPFSIGVRPTTFSLLIVPMHVTRIAQLDLAGCTIDDATAWIRAQMESLGSDPTRYTLKRHYEIPSHRVSGGTPFEASDSAAFNELRKWFANGFAVLSDLAREEPDSSEIRCWPHHFDIGTLIDLGAGRSIGVGLEPGDDYYDEPYFYVNMTPQPDATRILSQSLAGDGTWHTNQWIGAVLRGSQLGNSGRQNHQVREFLDSAVAAARTILMAN